MQFTPIRGLGVIVTGQPSQTPIEIWVDDELVHVGHLQGGSAMIPGASGRISVRSGGEELGSADIDNKLVAEPGPGPFELTAKRGSIEVWSLDAGGAAAYLGGGVSAARGKMHLALDRLAIPHAMQHIGVQVRDGNRIGPLRVMRYTPAPRPVALRVDHDAGPTGPRTHLLADTAGLQAVELEIRRHVRQTDTDSEARYEVQAGEERITLDDLLHGDTVVVSVEAPHALAGADGTAVARLTYRYRAVPEPRLENEDEGAPVDFDAGLAADDDAVLELLQTVSGNDLSVPAWRTEWPHASEGENVTSAPALVRAHVGKTDPGDIEHDAELLLWWLQLLDLGQDPAAAAALRGRLRFEVHPGHINAVATAIHFLDGLPGTLLSDLDIPQALIDDIAAFQERLGVKDQAGQTAVELADKTRIAVASAVEAWADGLEAAGVGWVDGALAPLDDGVNLASLRATLADAPQEGVKILRDKRRRIFKAARVPAVDATDAHDVEARRVLVRWHMDQGIAVMQQLADLVARVGVDVPKIDGRDVEKFGRTAVALARAIEVGGARVHAVPTKGPAFVDAAAAEARKAAGQVVATLGVWQHENIPPAMRSPIRVLLDQLDDNTCARLVVWSRFMSESAAWIRDMETMTASGGDLGKRARHVQEAFQEASERRDPVRFAEAAGDFKRLESAILAARDAWQNTIRTASESTRAALGIAPEGDTSWKGIRRRMTLDAAEIRALARLLLAKGAPDVRLATAIRPGGDLDEAVAAAEAAGPDIERAAAVAGYDRIRRRVAGWYDGDDAVSALRGAYVTNVVARARDRMRRSLGRTDNSRVAVIEAFPDVPGARELTVLAAFLTQIGNRDPQAADTVEEVSRIEGLMERLDAVEVDPWTAVSEQLRVGVRAIFPELVKYLQDHAPRWADLERPEDATQWLLEMCNGLRHPADNPAVAALKPGTQRLVRHVLEERGLWIAA